MKKRVQKIRFNGLDFILTCPDDNNSSIATIDTYKKGECSYAHLYRTTGVIRRFTRQIGTIEDIEFGEVIEIEIDLSEAIPGLLGDSWPF